MVIFLSLFCKGVDSLKMYCAIRCSIVHPSAVVVLHDGVTLIVDN